MTTADPRPGETQIFKRLTVDAYFNLITDNRVLVEWALADDFLESGPYEFILERGYGVSYDDADWIQLCRTVDQPWAYDIDPFFPQKGLIMFYRVRMSTGDGNAYTSQPASLGTYWDRYDYSVARDIIRKETMLLRKRAGTPGWLLKRRVFGDPCDGCVDPVTNQVLRPDCPDCYGTGIEGGYYDAWEYWVTLDPARRLIKLDDNQGMNTQVVETARCLSYPRPAHNDVWVHGHTGQRYAITGDITAIARHRGIDLVLSIRMEERARSEPIYGFPVPCQTTYGKNRLVTAHIQEELPTAEGG